MAAPLPQIAAAYIRVSTDDQVEYSPDAQLKALRRYAAQNNMVLDERYIFSDEGISGRKADKRPGFMTMIAQAKSKEHPFDVILVHKFDRFARSREDSVVYKSMLKRECNVRVISITESIEDDKFSVILEAMLEAMAEYYSINLAEEVKKGMTEKATRGELQHVPPFGYRAEDGVLVPVPEEAELVRQIFYRFSQGTGYLPLAKWMNAQGVLTHRGNPFEHRTIEYMLRNPVYVGKLRWTPTGKVRRDYHNPDTIIADARHEPLVSEELWQAVQDRALYMKAIHKRNDRESAEKKHWLCGLVRCASCNATLLGVYYKGNENLFLKCGNYPKGRCDHSQHVFADLVEQAFLEKLQYDATSAPTLSFDTAYVISDPSDDRSTIQKEIEQLTRKISRLREAFLIGADSAEEYAAAKRSMENRLSDLRKKLAAAEPPKDGDPQDLLRAAILSTLETLRSPTASVQEKHLAASSIVSSCTFQRKPESVLSITYRLIL